MTIHKHGFQYTFVFWWAFLGEQVGEVATTATDIYDEVKELKQIALGGRDGSMPQLVKDQPLEQQRKWADTQRINAISMMKEVNQKIKRQENSDRLADKTPEQLRAIKAAAEAMTGAQFRAQDCLVEHRNAKSEIKQAKKVATAAEKKETTTGAKFTAAEARRLTARTAPAIIKADGDITAAKDAFDAASAWHTSRSDRSTSRRG